MAVSVEDNLSNKLLLIDGKTWRMSVIALGIPEPSLEITNTQLQIWMAKETIVLIDARQLLEALPNTKGKIVCYCQSGQRSLALAQSIRQQGFEAYSLQGGLVDNI